MNKNVTVSDVGNKAGFCLSARQRMALDGVVARARSGMALSPACRKSGIRYNTAQRALGFLDPYATITTREMQAALAHYA